MTYKLLSRGFFLKNMYRIYRSRNINYDILEFLSSRSFRLNIGFGAEDLCENFAKAVWVLLEEFWVDRSV